MLLTALMEAADRVDSTCGVQMAFLKQWAPRAYHELELRVPALQPASPHGPCSASCDDALTFIANTPVDVAYLDPPYNQHSYLGNYHVWETLVSWDRPVTYGLTQKRMDRKERRSDFNSRRRMKTALSAAIDAVNARVMVVSFSDEGFLTREELVGMLARLGAGHVLATDFKRYIGAQIGIFSPSGERVGEVSQLNNQELLFVVDVAQTGVDWPAVLDVAARSLDITAASADTPRGRAARASTGPLLPGLASPPESPA